MVCVNVLFFVRSGQGTEQTKRHQSGSLQVVLCLRVLICEGHNYISHNYISHSYISQDFFAFESSSGEGHNYISHSYISHSYISHNYISHDFFAFESSSGEGLEGKEGVKREQYFYV